VKRILKAGLVYFALVFGAGFVLGFIRVTWVAPPLGTRTAELLEAPIMLAVCVLAARRVVRGFDDPPPDLSAGPGRGSARPGPAGLLAIGVLALAILLGFEFTLVLWLRGWTLAEYFESRDPLSGTVYAMMLGAFALMPLLVARRLGWGSNPG
jgi:hypothetical protein